MAKLKALILCMPLLVVACATPQPTATYEDPLLQIGRNVSSVAATQYKSMTLGIVFTDNTKKAMNVTTATRSRLTEMGIFTNNGALAEADPAFLAKAIDDALRRRFKDVLVLNSFDDRKSGGIDAVMFLDVQIVMGTRSGTHTTVAVQGVFVDGNQNPIAQVKGDGDATIPYPAFDYEFKPSAEQAVTRFAQSLDGSTDLASKLAAPVTPVAAIIPPPLPPLLDRPTVAAVEGKRVALVVGNAGYRNVPRLSNTTNDARLMAATLKKLGFEVVGGGALLDLDHDAFIKAVTSFGNQLSNGAVGVFYYAGHGLQMQGANFLVPIDANPVKPSDAEVQLVDANLVLAQMEDSGAKLKVVVLDACRNNPFGGRGLRDAGGGLAQMHAPEGTLISYATQPGNVASDGAPGGDSPYTIALSQAMTTKGMDVLELFNEVGVLVDNTTKGQQQPWVASSPIKGKFYFAGQ